MIVTCPACSTRYLVDPRALGSAGRMVRCANCANTWHQTPPEDFPQSVDLQPDEPGPALSSPRFPPPALPPPARSGFFTSGRLLLIALVAVGIIAAVVARASVVALFPPAARLYSMVGLAVPPPGAGLEIRKTSPRRDVENGVPVLIVEGEVANTSNVAVDVPKLRVMLNDANDNEVQSWTFSVTEPRLMPGASEPFHTSIQRPSSSAAKVAVDFDEPH
ncbi:MAG: zinc-ribbon domain-containing protein [Alphaproteobacteria bacterium]|nr:zinc-ribbon domain-containing protein [Alphaproteobacteria bacterium]